MHPQPPPYVEPPAPPRGPNPWPWVAFSVTVVAVAGVIAVLLLRDDDPGEPAAADGIDEIAAALGPVGAANDALSDDLDALDPGDDPDSALASAATALRRTRAARRELAGLDLSEDDESVSVDVERALVRELSYLGAVRRALRNATGSNASSASRHARRAREAFELVDPEIPGAGGRVAGLDGLGAWVSTPTIPDGDAGPGFTLGDGDAGPATPPPADGDAGGDLKDCGGFEGVFDIVAYGGVSCQEAGDVAIGAIESKSAAGANGFVCETVPEADPGTLRYECDGPPPDGGHVGFTVYR